jgi:hypothetical protein
MYWFKRLNILIQKFEYFVSTDWIYWLLFKLVDYSIWFLDSDNNKSLVILSMLATQTWPRRGNVLLASLATTAVKGIATS